MYGFDKNNYSDNAQDKDGDGYTNLEEFINGTNPNSADNTTGSAPTLPADNTAEPVSLLDFPYTLVGQEYVLNVELNAEETSVQFTTIVPDTGITF
jgi:hypothetical protein